MKKIFTLFAALAMVMSMFAASIPAGTKFYLTPSANWNQSNARFAVYFFGNGDAWVSMKKVAGENNLYEVTSPNKNYTNLIFCRMNPGTTANNWNDGVKWNQTSDLTYDGTKNHYTVKEGTWDKGGGTWSIWPIPEEKNYVDITVTVTANADAYIKWSNAGDKLANATDYVAMTAGENNTYTYTLAQVDEATGVNYTIKVGETISEENNTSKSVVVDFKDLMKKVVLKGVNSWDDVDIMTIADDYLSASITLPLNAEDYAWKLTIGGEWFGGNKYTINRNNNTAKVTDNGDGDGKLTADIAGDYVFTYTYADKTLVVTYPVLVQTINLSYDITSENIGNRDGRRQTISVEDENYGNPQLVIPGFNEEVAEYAEAFLSVGEETMTATATYTVDAENGKEVYTATATTADGSIIYNVTFTLTAPAVEEHTIMNLEYPTVTVEDFGGSKMYIIEGEAVMDTEDNVVNFNLTVFPSIGFAEGGIGTEIYGSGEATMSEPVDGEVYVEATLVDDAGNIYNFFIVIEAIEEEEVEIVITDTVTLDGYQLVLENQGNMAMVSAQVNGIELSFYLTWNEEENGYGTYEDASVTNVWYTIEGEEQQLTPYGNAHVYSAESLIVSCINTPDAEGNATLYQFTLYKGEKPEGPATSVGNVEVSAAAVKVIENGQLIVIKNGVKFNVLGAQVK